MTAEMIICFFGFCLLFIGSIIMLCSLINYLVSKNYNRIKAITTGCVHEYTSRGFFYRNQVEYVLNDITYYYITKSKFVKRGSGSVNLLVSNRGRVVEPNYLIESSLLGALFDIVAIVLLCYALF